MLLQIIYKFSRYVLHLNVMSSVYMLMAKDSSFSNIECTFYVTVKDLYECFDNYLIFVKKNIIMKCRYYSLLLNHNCISCCTAYINALSCRYPSHARMWVSPIRSGLGDQKKEDFESAMSDWYNFVAETDTHYGVNMNVLTKAYREENEKYYLKVLIKFSFQHFKNMILFASRFLFQMSLHLLNL